MLINLREWLFILLRNVFFDLLEVLLESGVPRLKFLLLLLSLLLSLLLYLLRLVLSLFMLMSNLLIETL